MKYKKIIIFFTFVLIFAVFIAAFLFFKDAVPKADEKVHYKQIETYINGHSDLHVALTTIPGYHSTIATIAEIFSLSSIQSIRLITFIFSLLLVIVFYLLLKKIHKDLPISKFFLLCFFPILFPFFFLIYTDIFSLVLILSSFYLLLNKKYITSGILGILSILVRQTNIIWLLFFCAYVFYEKYGFRFTKNKLISLAKDCWVFILGFISFFIFLIINKGVAIGDKAMHPPFTFQLENIFFLLFLFFFLFLPLNIANFKKIYQSIKKNKGIILFVLLTFLVFIITFRVNHPLNTNNFGYLRNNLLLYIDSALYLKILFFIPVAYSIFSISVIKLKEKVHYLLYPFTLLSLIPCWLIEQRYYLIPFILFIVFSKKNSILIEIPTIFIYIVVSVIFIIGMRYGFFYI